MSARRFLAAIALAALALNAPGTLAQTPAPPLDKILAQVRPDSRVEVFYLGAPDCPYCIEWELKERDDLVVWTANKGFGFAEIMGDSLRQPIVERHYPPRYRWVFEQIGPSRGVPRFLLALDGRVVLSTLGTIRYEQVFFPALREVAARRTNRP